MSRQPHKQKVRLDNYTFGDSKAEVALSKILTSINNPRLAKTVGKLLSGLATHIKNITFADEYLGTRSFLAKVLRTQMDYEVDRSWFATDHPEAVSYIKNCIAKKIKKFEKDEYKI